jgi:hypothetical protein
MRIILILTLFLSACNFSAVSSAPLTPTPRIEATVTPLTPSFACVTAIKALNVRDDKHIVIGWLYHGQKVQVSGAGDWVTINATNLTGKVRSIYLKPCETKAHSDD